MADRRVQRDHPARGLDFFPAYHGPLPRHFRNRAGHRTFGDGVLGAVQVQHREHGELDADRLDRSGAVQRDAGSRNVLGAPQSALVGAGNGRRSGPVVVRYVNESLGRYLRFLHSRSMSIQHRARAVAFAASLALAAVAPVPAQTMYRYKDATGVWVYTDRKPGAEQEYQQEQIERRFERPQVNLLQRSEEHGVTLIAQNTYYSPVQIAFRLRPIENVSPDTRRSGLATLPPRSETELVVVGKSVDDVDLRFDSEFEFIPGEPGVSHRPDQPYRLPYAF